MYNDKFNLKCKNAPVAIDIHRGYAVTNPHIHKEIEVIYVAKGKTHVKAGTHSFEASRGDLIFANPMEVHSLKPLSESEYEHYCICFDSSLISDSKLRDLLWDSTLIINHFVSCKETADIFLRLFEVAQKDEQTLCLEAGAYVSLLLADLIKRGLVTRISKPDKNSIFYIKVMGFIAKNFAEKITSLDAAKIFFYTQSHFCRTFAEKFGTSFSLFLNIYRIAKAKEILDSTSESITNVAFESGFSNLNYFSKCFKRQVGVSPSEYRKHQHNTNKSTI